MPSSAFLCISSIINFPQSAMTSAEYKIKCEHEHSVKSAKSTLTGCHKHHHHHHQQRVTAKLKFNFRSGADDQFIRTKAINGISGVELITNHQHRFYVNAHFHQRNYNDDYDNSNNEGFHLSGGGNASESFTKCEENSKTPITKKILLRTTGNQSMAVSLALVVVLIKFSFIVSVVAAANDILLTETATMLLGNLTRYHHNNHYNNFSLVATSSIGEDIDNDNDADEVTSPTLSLNRDISFNDSDDLSEDAAEYIFDRTDVRIIFITLYTLVFCCCFFGNLLVILVVTMSRRLRSITNFFLANLAVADFCVGLFCVMQNLSIYLIDSWVFGEFLCRMYQFVHSLSYTASIFILVVICMERYFAIVHPITCKQILTAARLRIVILTVWIGSAIYSTPKFVFSKTIKNIHTEDGQEEEICVLDRKMYNSKLLDMINFGLLYVIPLLVMTVLYSKIAIALWRSSHGLKHHMAVQQQHHHNQQQENGITLHNSMYQHHHSHHHYPQPAGTSPIASNSGSGILSRKQSSKYDNQRGISVAESQDEEFQVSLESDRPIVTACRKTSFYQHQQQNEHSDHIVHHHPAMPLHPQHLQPRHSAQRVANMSHPSNNVLRARRGVVRMLIIFVLTFALCNLPYHARKMWQYWSRSYRGDSNFNALLTPLTFLVTYFNSGVNPLLYAFLSRNFRKGMKELLLCSWKKGKGKSSSNSSMHHKRITMQTHSLPTDTTHIGNEQL